MEAVDQGLGARIGLWVEALVRMAVAGQEAFEAKHIGMIGAADDHRPAGAHIEQPDPAQDQGAHDALAEFGLFHHQIAQPARRNDQGLDRRLGVGLDQGRPVGQLRKLAHERARAMGHDQLGMSEPVALHDIDPPRQNNECAW